MAWRIGVDIGGTFTDVALVDEASGHIGVAKVPTTPRDLAEGVLAALRIAMQRYGVAAGRGRAAGARHHRRHQRHPRGEGRARRAHHHARLPRRAGAAALRPRRPLRPVPGCAGHADPAPAPLRDHRAHRRRRRRRHAAGRSRDRWPDRRAEGGARRGGRRLAAVQLPQPRARAAARRAPARRAARHADLPVLRGAARDQGVRAHQHDGGVRLRRADPRLLPRSGWRSATRSQGLPPLYVMGSNGGILEAGEAVAMPAMAVEFGPAAGVVAAALVARQTGRAQPPVLRHGRHHRQGQPDPRRPVRDHARVRGRRRRQRQPLDARHRPSRSACPSSTWPRCRPAAARSPGSIAPARCASARRAPAPSPVPSATAAAAPSRPSPTATCCSAISTRARCSAATCRSITRRPRPPSRERLAEPLGVDARTAAAAVIDVVNHAMAEALKIVSVQRGHDPREFVLAAFGGAGPLHAAALADELGIAEVICPPIPGAFSALGLVGTDLKRDYVRTVYATTAERRSGRAGGRLRRAGARGRRHARPRRRRAGAAALRALRRCALRAPVLRAVGAGAAARSMRRRSPRSPRPSTTAIAPPTATTTAASRCSSSACASPPSAPSRRC